MFTFPTHFNRMLKIYLFYLQSQHDIQNCLKIIQVSKAKSLLKKKKVIDVEFESLYQLI